MQTTDQTPINFEILTKTFDDLPVGVGIFHIPDTDDIKSIRYVFMNKVLLYEMRKTRDEVFGKRIEEVAPEAYEHDGGLLVIETYYKVAKEGGSINLGLVEYSNHMVAGTYECSVHHIKENYVYVMLRNVTELEQTKNRLEIKNNELTQFSYLVSHDLKSPLNNISSLVDLMKNQYQSNLGEEFMELIRLISESTERMKRLVVDLLDFSGVGEGKKTKNVDISKLLESIKQDLSDEIKESGTKLHIDNLPVIEAYETELRMLFQNLISNAIKFRKANSSPHISIYAEEKDGWTFYIQDDGIGIADEHKEKVFKIFQRLHTSREYQGTGIGLAHCKKVVDLHGGKLGFDSTLGGGTTFIFNIPTNLGKN